MVLGSFTSVAMLLKQIFVLLAGWCDSMNGLAGTLLLGGLGIARTMESKLSQTGPMLFHLLIDSFAIP